MDYLRRPARRLSVFLAACAITSALLVCTAAAPAAEPIDFPSADFGILSTDSGKVVGKAHYALVQTDDQFVLRGQSRYSDGRSDSEEEQLRSVAGQPLPVLVSFRHYFFSPDGQPERGGSLDVTSGLASCVTITKGKQTVKNERFELPADTYAGASILIPIRQFLKRRDPGVLRLHAFSCSPIPRLLSVKAKPEPPAPWPSYPGELVRVRVTPEFGFWSFIIKPFLPKLAAWFDPDDGWNVVGARLDRYYRGPRITLLKWHVPGHPAGDMQEGSAKRSKIETAPRSSGESTAKVPALPLVQK